MEVDNVSAGEELPVSDKISDEESNAVETGGGDNTNLISVPGDRIKRRAKRLSRQGSKEGVSGNAVGGKGFLQTTRRWKNSRRPRNGHGRGLPKKGYYYPQYSINSIRECDLLHVFKLNNIYSN